LLKEARPGALLLFKVVWEIYPDFPYGKTLREDAQLSASAIRRRLYLGARSRLPPRRICYSSSPIEVGWSDKMMVLCDHLLHDSLYAFSQGSALFPGELLWQDGLPVLHDHMGGADPRELVLQHL